MLGNRFLADDNAKNTLLGSRFITPKGREFVKPMTNNLKHISAEHPNYWLMDGRKTANLLRFSCYKRNIDKYH